MEKLVLACVAGLGAIAMGQVPFELQRIGDVASDATIPWVKSTQAAWSGEPTFEVAEGKLAMKGWLATTSEELLIRVDVTDAVHVNSQTGGDIWNGDFLRVAIDGKGDGAAGGAADTSGLFGPDDASIGFALTPTGPQGYVYASTTKRENAYPAERLKFARDEAASLTRYEVRIPWSDLSVEPGVFPQFGIVVQVRNVDSQDQREPVHVRWGDGANEPKPGLFRKVAAGTPPAAMIKVLPGSGEIWERGDRATMVIAISGNGPVKVSATAGARQFEQEITSSGETIQRYRLSYSPATGDETLVAELTRGDSTAKASMQVSVADAVVDAFITKVEELLARAEHPLFARHLRSVKAMVESEWARASLYKKSNPALARETLGYVRNLIAGFSEASGEWDNYVKEGLPLFMAYVSGRDGTLQWYTLTLPKEWDEQKPYPMFFELHGAGNAHYLNNLAGHLGTGEVGSGLLGYERPRTYAMIQREGYHVFPFGRGNTGYRDIGETDVWEAYNDAHKTVKIDPDRRYLYGFSMGGGGTWNLGSRTPDRWAAMAVLGMGARVADWGQALNVANTPIYTWGGETDTIAYRGGAPKDIVARFAEAIRAAGGTVEAKTTPGVGHNYLGEIQEESIEWMKKHTRKRPDKFTFVADTDQHRGVWGITMTRDLQMSPFPRFDCTIDHQAVSISTKGTPRVEIDLGEDGLNMPGEIKLTVNGKAVEVPERRRVTVDIPNE